MDVARPGRERRQARFARGAQVVRRAPTGAVPIGRSLPPALAGGKMVCVHKPTSCNHVVTIPERGWAVRDCERTTARRRTVEPLRGR